MVHCSFCLNSGHNIKKCNSHSLIVIGNLLRIYKNKYTDVKHYVNWIFYKLLNQDNDPDNFLHDFKAFAVRFCKSKMRDNIFQMVANVLRTIYGTTDNNSISECLSFLKTFYELDNTDVSLNGKFLLNWIKNPFNITFKPTGMKIHVVEPNFELKPPFRSTTCSICLEDKLNINMAQYLCRHLNCTDCIAEMIKQKEKNTPLKCPCCRSIVNDFYIFDVNDNFSKLHNASF